MAESRVEIGFDGGLIISAKVADAEWAKVESALAAGSGTPPKRRRGRGGRRRSDRRHRPGGLMKIGLMKMKEESTV